VIGLDLSREVISHIQGRHPALDVQCATLETSGLCLRRFDIDTTAAEVEAVYVRGLRRASGRTLRPASRVARALARALSLCHHRADQRDDPDQQA
jgi:hypothetical protein